MLAPCGCRKNVTQTEKQHFAKRTKIFPENLKKFGKKVNFEKIPKVYSSLQGEIPPDLLGYREN